MYAIVDFELAFSNTIIPVYKDKKYNELAIDASNIKISLP